MIAIAATGVAGWREWQRLEALQEKGWSPGQKGWAMAAREAGLRPRQCEKIPPAWRGDEAEKIEARCRACGVGCVSVEEAEYPRALMNLPNPPLVVFFRGSLPGDEEHLVAIVGSRRASRYGRRQARAFAEDLAGRGLGVVSGLARGVDTEAHRGSLSGPGRGFAVLGSGLDEPYPPENVGLAMDLEAQGALLSEFPPGTPPRPHHFPRRNRLIAALASCVIVIEAAERSGALITARWANDLGRDVAALPGPVDAITSAGPLALLRDGAHLIRSPQDLEEDGLIPMRDTEATTESSSQSAQGRDDDLIFDADERRLLALLDREPTDLDSLLGALDLAPGTVLSKLLSLELRGVVERDEALRFALNRPLRM